ncbi:MAG: hypothetical protein K2J82_06840 [Muribaculaceae bacterium]|nr:hypothetical protein [Muribaculaceae bacterium]MDE6754310.1 hypothetical protein [Muribaculaceae bacterium]
MLRETKHIRRKGDRFSIPLFVCLFLFFCGQHIFSQNVNIGRLPKVYDIEAAKETCDALPLDAIEGIWVYPDDNVTVLVRRLPKPSSTSSLQEYQLMVVESPDCRLEPGDVIGTLSASPEPSKFTLNLSTERKNGVFSNSQTCTATLSKDAETMILSREKSKFRLRININPNTLLPTLWKSLLRFGISVGSNGEKNQPAPGMVKIYPSYDGNGSSRRKPRYL